eukprot:COSAG02_NODE_761_length_17476_cov_195.233067_5_plen_426_part_00
MLATWRGEAEQVVESTTPTVCRPIVVAATRREAQARSDRSRHKANAVVPTRIPSAILKQQPLQQPLPPTVTAESTSSDFEASLSDEELALREAASTQARLRYAALEGDVETIDLLLRGSTVGRRPRPPVPPDVASDDGWTPLMYACLQGHYNAAQLLVARGANVYAVTALDDTPLTLAAAVVGGTAGHEDSARASVTTLLLDAGADVDAANRMGMTALHRAALHGAKGVARVLLQRGARPELLCKHGLSAVDRAAIGSNIRETIVRAQLKLGRRRVVSAASADAGHAWQPQSLESSLQTNGTVGSQLTRRPSVGATVASLSNQVIDRHCSFSGVPSWQRVESIDSRLHDLVQAQVGVAPGGKRRVGSASMQLRKLNLSTSGTSNVATGHGSKLDLHVVAEGKHIVSPAEARQLQANAFVSVSAQF